MNKPPPSLPQLRQSLKQALATTPKDATDLRHGLAHALAAIERAESKTPERNDKR